MPICKILFLKVFWFFHYIFKMQKTNYLFPINLIITNKPYQNTLVPLIVSSIFFFIEMTELSL